MGGIGSDTIAKKEQIKILRAGRVQYMIQYTSLRGGVAKQNRQPKRNISAAVRESMNFRTSKMKLWLILESTFNPSDDLYVSFTYRDADLPKNKDEANRRFAYFIRALREARNARAQDTVYVWVTEGQHGDKRLHHHLLINGTGDDYAMMHDLWKWGDQVEIWPYHCKKHWDHAEYFAKEVREKGRRRVGERMWRASRNIKRPVITYETAKPGSLLAAPAGSYVVEKDQKDNTFGRFQYVHCILPDVTN